MTIGVAGDSADRWPVLQLVLASIGFILNMSGLVAVGLLPQIVCSCGGTVSEAGLITASFAGGIVLTVLPLMRATWRIADSGPHGHGAAQLRARERAGGD